jgi:hypothetical protein
MPKGSVEARLAALEQEVARLREILSRQQELPWWEKIVGTFANDPVYERAMKYGRAYRNSLRTGSRKKRGRGHGST